MTSLNLNNLIQSPDAALVNLSITDSFIGSIGSVADDDNQKEIVCEIKLLDTSENLQIGSYIKDSSVGTIDECGMNFFNSENGSLFHFSVVQSQIGHVMPGGIKIPDNSVVMILNSKINLVEANSFLMDESYSNVELTMENNTITAPEAIFQELNCENNSIFNNNLTIIQYDSSNQQNTTKLNSCQEENNIYSYNIVQHDEEYVTEVIMNNSIIPVEKKNMSMEAEFSGTEDEVSQSRNAIMFQMNKLVI